jgi:hypothetical protein
MRFNQKQVRPLERGLTEVLDEVHFEVEVIGLVQVEGQIGL